MVKNKTMKITSKFNIGDRVIGIDYNRQLQAFDIAKITISAKADRIEIDYYPSDGNGGYEYMAFNEKYCFNTINEATAYIVGGLR